MIGSNIDTRVQHGPVGAPKVAYVKELLLTLKSRLEADLESPGETNWQPDHRLQDSPGFTGIDVSDNGILTDEYDGIVTYALRHNTQQYLAQISEALTQIDEGRYGVCANCLGPISPDRLVVRPFSTLCVGCQASLDRRKGLRS